MRYYGTSQQYGWVGYTKRRDTGKMWTFGTSQQYGWVGYPERRDRGVMRYYGTSQQYGWVGYTKRRTQGSKPKRVPQRTLKRLVRDGQCLRTGVSQNPKKRFGQYKRDNKYKDTDMWYAYSKNIMRTEDSLLSYGTCQENKQQLSNAQPVPGYAYVIRKRIPGNKPRSAVAGGWLLKQMINFFLWPSW